MAQKNWLEIEINNKNHKKEKNAKKYKKVLHLSRDNGKLVVDAIG